MTRAFATTTFAALRTTIVMLEGWPCAWRSHDEEHVLDGALWPSVHTLTCCTNRPREQVLGWPHHCQNQMARTPACAASRRGLCIPQPAKNACRGARIPGCAGNSNLIACILQLGRSVTFKLL